MFAQVNQSNVRPLAFWVSVGYSANGLKTANDRFENVGMEKG